MSRFRGSGGGVTARFTATEAAIIRTLVSQIADLVQADRPPRLRSRRPGPAAARHRSPARRSG